MGKWRKCSHIHLACSPPFNRRSSSWDKAFGSGSLQAGKGEQILYIQAMLFQHFQCSSSCCLNGETVFTATSQAAGTLHPETPGMSKRQKWVTWVPNPAVTVGLTPVGTGRPDFPCGSSSRRKVGGSHLDVMWGRNTSPFRAGGRAKADVLISPQGSSPGKHLSSRAAPLNFKRW